MTPLKGFFWGSVAVLTVICPPPAILALVVFFLPKLYIFARFPRDITVSDKESGFILVRRSVIKDASGQKYWITESLTGKYNSEGKLLVYKGVGKNSFSSWSQWKKNREKRIMSHQSLPVR